jgi:uncharacterized membrane protein
MSVVTITQITPPAGTSGRVVAIANDGTAALTYTNSTTHPARYVPGAGASAIPLPAGCDTGSPTDISDDGSVVCGSAFDSGDAFNTAVAWRWTSLGGTVVLSSAVAATPYSTAGMSADGSVIVGRFGADSFIWNALDGVVLLDLLGPLGADNAIVAGVSGDGLVVVGYYIETGTGDTIAFKWTDAGGAVPLDQPVGSAESYAYNASTDGSLIIGESWPGDTVGFAYRWDEGTPSEVVGSESTAFDFSEDGSVVSGFVVISSAQRAYVVSNGSAYSRLPELAAATKSNGLSVSANGAYIGGYCRTSGTDKPCYWLLGPFWTDFINCAEA